MRYNITTVMPRTDLPSSSPDRKKLWSIMTVHMTRRASDYFRHGVEAETPRIHELVMMNDDYLLKRWLVEHPDDLENRFRLKTPLLLAIKHNAYDCFQILMQNNANMEEYNPQNETALLIAVRLNRGQMIKDLVTQGASLLPEDRMARTALEILISRDDVENVMFIHNDRQNLLDHDLHNQEFPLSLAISHQARKCIDYILSLQPKAQTFLISRKHNCPIEAAIRRNDIQTMATLVTLEDFPYIVNQKIHKSISYIHLAVQKRRAQIVEFLLRNEAFVNSLDNDRNTPAHYASDIPTLKVLIHYGADMELRNKYKETPQMTAQRENKNCIYQFLRLYSMERKQRPLKLLNDRFGRYYKEQLQRSLDIEKFNTSKQKLPELREGQPPPLELAWDVFEEEHKRKNPVNLVVKNPSKEKVQQQIELLVEQKVISNAQHNNLELPRSDMNRLDDNIPIVKVRHLKRLNRNLSPNPPGLGYVEQHSSSPTHWSEESDHEKEIEINDKIKQSLFTNESEDELDDNN